MGSNAGSDEIENISHLLLKGALSLFFFSHRKEPSVFIQLYLVDGFYLIFVFAGLIYN